MQLEKVPSKSFAIMYLFLIFQVSFKKKKNKKKKKRNRKKPTICIKLINTKYNSYITFGPAMRSR